MRLQPQESKTRKETLRIKKKKRLVEESEILSDQTLKDSHFRKASRAVRPTAFHSLACGRLSLAGGGRKTTATTDSSRMEFVLIYS